jgi:hypothetical protein
LTAFLIAEICARSTFGSDPLKSKCASSMMGSVFATDPARPLPEAIRLLPDIAFDASLEAENIVKWTEAIFAKIGLDP